MPVRWLRSRRLNSPAKRNLNELTTQEIYQVDTRRDYMQPTTAGNVAGAAREKVEGRGADVMDQAKRKAGQVYDQANRSLNEQYERAIGYGRENPGKTTLIAFGVGVGV